MRRLLGDQLLICLQKHPTGTLQTRIFKGIRELILLNSLTANTRLPASRDLANELSVSRNTILSVYEQLRAEGYVEARTGKGTWVSEKLPEDFLNPPKNIELSPVMPIADNTLSQRGNNLINMASSSPHQWGAFVPGAPDVTEFPHQIFNKIYAKYRKKAKIDDLIYSNSGGTNELRAALASYLKIARSVDCTEEQIIITEGIHQAIDLISRTLSDIHDNVWIEEPSYWGLRNILEINGAKINAIPVDKQGINIREIDQPESPKLIFVTPSHQYPLGSHLSIDRRQDLIDFAKQHDSWIVEDDYDSEFRFSGHPYPSLQGLETDAPVIYMGTFSKTLYPAMRLGYLVVPKKLFNPVRLAAAELFRGGHHLIQLALAEFIREGYYEAHIRRMRILYGKRRKYLVNLIEKYLGKQFIHEFDDEAGLHLVMKLPDDLCDVHVAQLSLAKGIKVRALSKYYTDSTSKAQKGLLMGFACVPEQDMYVAFSGLLHCLKEAGLKLDEAKL